MKTITSKRIIKKCLYILALYSWIELMSFVALLLLARKFPNAVYTPPRGQVSQQRLSINLRDPLGWGSETIQTSSKDKTSHTCRIHLFGDSYMEADTYDSLNLENGQKMSPEDILSSLTKCRVINHSEGGYGSDQAYLKFLKKIDDSSIHRGDYVVLSHLTENILRNSNRNRSLLEPKGQNGALILKPVFKLVNGKLLLMPIPKNIAPNELELLKTNQYPTSLSEGENPKFIPGHTWGSPALISYSYFLNLTRAIVSWHVLPRFFNAQRYDAFYQEDSDSYQVTLGIIKAFHKKCEHHGCIPISIDLPVADDFGRYFIGNENHFIFTRDLKQSNIHHESIGELQSKSYPQLQKNKCYLHDGSTDGGDLCDAHYNQKGYISFLTELSKLINSKKLN